MLKKSKLSYKKEVKQRKEKKWRMVGVGCLPYANEYYRKRGGNGSNKSTESVVKTGRALGGTKKRIKRHHEAPIDQQFAWNWKASA